MTPLESVVKYFLNIFRMQVEFAEKQAVSSDFSAVADDPWGDHVFELRAECGGKCKTRRMSIRQLGESVESKSTCFKVTYDDILVVKIPPRPFPDFETYLKSTRTEKLIARQLSPAITCLYPAISGILKKIPQVNPGGPPATASETAYIQMLSRRPGLQNYLKIGDRLAFFMDLSPYAFLNQILDTMHEEKNRIPEAIQKNRDTFFDLEAFETIYGTGHEDIFFAINALYRAYQKRLDQISTHNEGFLSIPGYLREEWFFDWLTGSRPEITSSGYSAPVAAKIEKALASITEREKQTLSHYEKLVHEHVRRKIFDSNQTKMAALIANTLKLIARLNKQGVAVRDLKPDNIFIARNFDGADHILGDPETYDLGLIDLETAISLTPERPDAMEQPLMAGTPNFMTPSQLFANHVLIELFGRNTPRVMYMQDWYAAVGIIFNIVTGEHLFYRTARLIPEIMRLKQKAARQPPEIFKHASWNFWQTASTELAEKIQAHKKRLHSLQILLTPEICAAFSAEAVTEGALLAQCEHQMIRNQVFFPKSRDVLANARPETLRKTRLKYETRLENAPAPSQEYNHMLTFLKNLEAVKSQITNTRKLAPPPEDKPVSAARLMNILFFRAFHAMYNPIWSDRPMPAVEMPEPTGRDGVSPPDNR